MAGAGVKGPFQSRVGHVFCKGLQSYKIPAVRARELFKPYGFSKSSSSDWQKFFVCFRFGVFWRWRHKWGCFCVFWPHLPGPGRQSIETFFVSIFLEIRPRSACLAEVEPDPDCRSRLREDSAFFFRTRIKKSVKNWTQIRSYFSISAVVGVCAVIS